MTTYYIDATTGDDSDTGLTEALAWQTIGKISTEFAAGTFNAGDQILLRRGETWAINASAQRLRIRGCSGAIGNHITIADYGTGALPCLDAGTATHRMIYHASADAGGNYITLRNLDIMGTYDSTGIRLEGVRHWNLENLNIHDITRSGGGWCAGIRIKDNSEYIWVGNCDITDIEGEGIYLADGSDANDRTRRCMISNCTITNTEEGIDLKQGASSNFIYNCTFVNAGLSGNDMIGVGGRYNIIYNCTFEGTAHLGAIYLGRYGSAGYSGRYNRVERCLFKNVPNYGGVYLWEDHNEIINCTFVGCAYGVRGNSNATGAHTIKNCIFSGSTEYDVYLSNSEGRYDFDYNCYSDGATGIWYESGASRNFTYVQALGQETNGITTTADFAETGMYTLSVGSGCRNQGDSSVVFYDWCDEYAGAGAVDMGWREYGDYHEVPPGELPQRTFNSFFEDSGVFARFTGSAGGISASGNVPTPLVGQRQMVISIADTTDRYAYRTGLGSLMHFYAAVHVDIDSLIMTSGDLFNIFEGRTAGDTVIVVIQLYYDGASVQVRAGIRDDALAWHYTSYFNLGSDWRLIEIFWLAAPYSTENEGELVLWVDGIEEEHIDGLNNHDATVDRFYIGAVSGLDAGTSGHLYLDAVRLDWVRYLGEYYGTTVYTYTTVT